MDTTYLNYKYRLYPTKTQAGQMAKTINAQRFVWNYFLYFQKKYWEKHKEKVGTDAKGRSKYKGKFMGGYDLRKEELTPMRKKKEWLQEVDSYGLNMKLYQLCDTLMSFKKLNRGYPRFKRVEKNKGSFLCEIDSKRIRTEGDSKRVQLPKVGKVKIIEHRPLPPFLKNEKKSEATVAKDGDRWYITIRCEVPLQKEKPITTEAQVIGLDLNSKKQSAITFSDGTKEPNPKFYADLKKRIEKLQKNLSRCWRGNQNQVIQNNPQYLTAALNASKPDKISQLKQEFTKATNNLTPTSKEHKALLRKYGKQAFNHLSQRHPLRGKVYKATSKLCRKSNRWQKASLALHKINQHWREKQHRWTHTTTAKIISSSYDGFILEDLNIKGFQAYKGQMVRDFAFGKFRQMIEYKAKQQGKTAEVVDRFYPSSKTCSKCGTKKAKMPPSQRVFICDQCGHKEDRDINAAKNIKQEGTKALLSPKPTPNKDT